MNAHWSGLLIISSIGILMAMSFYLPMATGALFVVPIATMGIGAYCAGLLTRNGHSPMVAYLAAVFAGSAAALLSGALVVRMKAWSAAIASLAIVEVIQSLMQNYQLIGASLGLFGVPLYATVGVAVASCLGLVVVLAAIDVSRMGDVMHAVREDDLAAECSGVRVMRVRLGTFVVSGGVAGLAGALQAGYLGFVDPTQFGFQQLNNYLVAAILGGSTTAAGPLIGGVVTNGVPEVVTFAASYTLIVFSVVVILVLLIRPMGLVSRDGIRRSLRGVALLGRRLRRRPEAPGAGDAAVSVRGKTPRFLSRRPDYEVLRVRDVRKRFGGVHVLKGVSLEVTRGRVLGVIGANGAGKTSLVNVVTGVVKADGGEVEVAWAEGRRTRKRLTPTQGVTFGLARTFQAGRLFSGLSARQHLQLVPGVNPLPLLALVGLEEKGEEEALSLPYGEQRLLEIARALATSPSFLILDEPAAGMSAQEADRVAELVRKLASSGMGVLVIDHNVEFISGVSDWMIAMDFGVVVASDVPTKVLSHPEVVRAYLGFAREHAFGAPDSVDPVLESSSGVPSDSHLGPRSTREM